MLILLAALAVDALVGDPPALFRRVPHPVALIGSLIGGLERGLNRSELGDSAKRWRGIAAVLVTVALAAGVGVAIDRVSAAFRWGFLIEIAAVALLVAQRSLFDHVLAVARALERGGLAGGREAVSHIVGRNPEHLDAHGVARAAIESLAENFSDGVVAPVFWYVLLGMPGICAMKAINTLDSMLGHRSERYRAFGWAAARLDDLANLLPARLAGALLVLAAVAVPGTGGGHALRAMLRDARKHRSPNAGWPEAAMAGALGLSFGGPRRYGSELVSEAWLGSGSAEALPADIRRALGVFLVACVLQATLVAAIAGLRAGL
ncbi:MAG TPA: adenosylcobinamide-phosphate synthase CbiB [Stellaceae bacterium]|nr:adenosylcobinamide-phosphate synthase CbiB [Stellaceae bacterium]